MWDGIERCVQIMKGEDRWEIQAPLERKEIWRFSEWLEIEVWMSSNIFRFV